MPDWPPTVTVRPGDFYLDLDRGDALYMLVETGFWDRVIYVPDLESEDEDGVMG